MSIIGIGLDSWVQTQVDTRQSKLSLGNSHDIDTIKYTTSKAPFLRLTSGVDVSSEDKIRELGLDLNMFPTGSSLARKFVLEAARFPLQKENSDIDPKIVFKDTTFTSGVDDAYNPLLNPSYGFFSTPNSGLVPPPGIVSANIRSLNRGSLREATIRIVCHNLAQFRVINALFLKLKYSLLLEWGHSLYFNNDQSLLPNRTLLSDNFIDGKFFHTVIKPNGSEEYKTGYDQQSLLLHIKQLRELTSGNYDAFFGVVKNFTWELLENGSYNIVVTAISTGDVIESLKINSNLTPNEVYNPNINDPLFQKSTFHRILGDIVVDLNSTQTLNGTNSGRLCTEKIASASKVKFNYKDVLDHLGVKSPNNILEEREGRNALIKGLEKVSGIDQNQNYITLGTLLRIIESFIIHYDTSKGYKHECPDGDADCAKNQSTVYPPVFFINHNYEDNKCLTIPAQSSINPRVCLVPLGFKLSVKTAASFLAGKYNVTEKLYTFYHNDDGSWSLTDTKSSTKTDVTGISPSILNKEYVSNISLVAQKILPIGTLKSDPRLTISVDTFDKWLLSILNNKYAFNPNKDYVFLSNPIDVITDPVPIQAPLKTTQWYLMYVHGYNMPNSEFLLDETIYNKVYNGNSITTRGQNIPREIKLATSYYQVITDPSTSAAAVSEAKLLKSLNPKFRTDDKFTARTMFINVNIDFIIQVLNNNVDKYGEISVHRFLIELMSGISRALGSINDFEVVYNNENNTYYIIDNAYLSIAYNNVESSKGKFNINLLQSNPVLGSFVTEYSLKSDIFSTISNATQIGAQVNGNTLNSNSALLAKYNSGSIDRILTTKQNINYDPNDKKDFSTKYSSAWSNYVEYLARILDDNSIGISETEISQYESSIIDLFQYDLGNYTVEKNIPGSGLVPLSLKLTMDGLSGINVLQAFEINSRLLPDDFRDRLRFIIKTITHDINSQGWTTTFDSLSVVKEKYINTVVALPADQTVEISRGGSESGPRDRDSVKGNLDTWGSGHNTSIFNDDNLSRFDPSITDPAAQKEAVLVELRKLSRRSTCMGSNDVELYYKFAEELIKAITGVPATYAQLWFMSQWFRAENTAARFNPLATTQGMSGAGNFNSAGVKNFNDFNQGLEATIITLKNKYYPVLRQALQNPNLNPLGIFSYRRNSQYFSL